MRIELLRVDADGQVETPGFIESVVNTRNLVKSTMTLMRFLSNLLN